MFEILKSMEYSMLIKNAGFDPGRVSNIKSNEHAEKDQDWIRIMCIAGGKTRTFLIKQQEVKLAQGTIKTNLTTYHYVDGWLHHDYLPAYQHRDEPSIFKYYLNGQCMDFEQFYIRQKKKFGHLIMAHLLGSV